MDELLDYGRLATGTQGHPVRTRGRMIAAAYALMDHRNISGDDTALQAALSIGALEAIDETVLGWSDFVFDPALEGPKLEDTIWTPAQSRMYNDKDRMPAATSSHIVDPHGAPEGVPVNPLLGFGVLQSGKFRRLHFSELGRIWGLAPHIGLKLLPAG